MQTIISILQNRIDALGVSGATINSQGGNVVVQVPGLANRQQLLNTIQQTAELLFRPVLCEAPPYTPPAKGKTRSDRELPDMRGRSTCSLRRTSTSTRARGPAVEHRARSGSGGLPDHGHAF